MESPRFRRGAERIAAEIGAEVDASNARSWRAAAMKTTRAREIYRLLQAELGNTRTGRAVQSIVRENAELIQSIPIRVSQRVTNYIANEQQAGTRAKEIEQGLRQLIPHVAAEKIRLIARTEVAKAETALQEARSADLDIDYYVWLTSEDSRVRESHRIMNGVIVPWRTPPSPEMLAGERSQGAYHAGGIYNCRCLANPLVNLDELRWPHKFFDGNKIKLVTRAQFQRNHFQRAA